MTESNVEVVRSLFERYERDGIAGVLETAGEAVIAHIRLSGRGASSGLDADLEAFVVHELRNGRIVRMRPYAELQEAQAAAGGR